MYVVVVAIVLSTWTVLLAAVASHSIARISSSKPRSAWLPIASCAPIVVFGSSQERELYALAATFACLALIVGAVADARTGYLFDAITLPAAVVTATLAVAAGSASEATAGVILLVGIFGAVAVFSRGRAIGLGDVKAMYAIGAGFGPAKAIVILFAASVSGLAVTALARCFERRGMAGCREIRFGPYLAIGSSVALIAGDRIVHGALGL
jgi:leader peptidase (prepilin peptidase)/N-methyltransferase